MLSLSFEIVACCPQVYVCVCVDVKRLCGSWRWSWSRSTASRRRWWQIWSVLVFRWTVMCYSALAISTAVTIVICHVAETTPQQISLILNYGFYCFATERCWRRHYVFQLYIHHTCLFILSFVRPDRPCYHDFVRTTWAIAMKLAGNNH